MSFVIFDQNRLLEGSWEPTWAIWVDLGVPFGPQWVSQSRLLRVFFRGRFLGPPKSISEGGSGWGVGGMGEARKYAAPWLAQGAGRVKSASGLLPDPQALALRGSWDLHWTPR